ncbi:MAG: hypothetical protein ACFCUI_12785, partial [Bernardetiaceae bacterium]
MGKSYIIREKWLEQHRYLHTRFSLDDTVDVVAYLLKELSIPQEDDEYSEVQLKRLFSKHKEAIEGRILYFENVEALMLLKAGNSQHKLIAPFESLLKALVSACKVKIVLESRYEVDFGTIRNQVAFLESKQLQALPSEHYREMYLSEMGFQEKEFERLYQKTEGNTWFMKLAIPADLADDSISKKDFLENVLNKPFEDYQRDFLQKAFDALDEASDTELLLRAAFAYGDIRYADFEQFRDSFLSLRKKLLLNKISDGGVYTINGFVRETCRIYFATSPLMQQIEREEQQKVGKTHRIRLTAAQRIDKYTFLTEQAPNFILYVIELAKAQQENGQVQEAEQNLRKCVPTKNKKSKQVIYNCLIHLCSSSKQAQKVFEEMKSFGVNPNEVTYNTYLNKTERFEQAQKVFEEMKSFGVNPDYVTYSTYLNKTERFEQAQKVFEEMKSFGVNPNEVTYNTYL